MLFPKVFFTAFNAIIIFYFYNSQRIISSLENKHFCSYLPKPDSIETLGELLGPKYLLGDFGQF